MPSENEELLARISQLAGQINRHKAAVASSASASSPSSSSRPPQQQSQQAQQPYPTRHQPYPTQHHHSSTHRSYGSSTWAPARGATVYRSRGRGGARIPTGHRNRTLVLNSGGTGSNTNSNANNSPSDTPNAATDDELMPDAADASATKSSTRAASAPASNGTAGTGSWVAKRDRHMQLINSSVYDQRLQARAKAIEQTRQDKLKRKEDREKAKLRSFLQGSKQYGIVSTNGNVRSKMAKVATYQHEIIVNGARFKITVDGSKLVKVSEGKLQRYVDSFTDHSDPPPPPLGESHLGKCVRGNTCPYVHDPDRVAICPKFLQNNCPDGDSCDLSHVPNPHRVPACVHFLRGNCSNEQCKYAHVRVNPSAPICRPFAKEGYCDKGADCPDKHVFECPDFDQTGVCKDKACKLPHIEHAGRRRAAAAAKAAKLADEGDSDVSSDDDNDEDDDDDEHFGSDDVDSDYFSDSEVILQTSTSDDGHEVSQQADFIRF
ncbi:hypothetical protein Dda_7455 [Drechslerella dactyloides]|uniref:C3H1-type domain-containing protein n=1 Tax=Drechslerella dactyloides TaxID=74499 RepID=A0AAD6ISE1_DREDA|nr:hypothetical protein Dda_7455 [Drechslerella dactyloides]